MASHKIQCPKGHTLPRSSKYGECTPVHCASTSSAGSTSKVLRDTNKAKRELIKTIKTDADNTIAKVLDGLSDVQKQAAITSASEESVTLAHLTGRRAARQAIYKIPENLTGAEAEEHAQKRAVELLPFAMAEIEHQLLYGDDTQRRDAARDVLDINGMRKREASSGNGGATIILNLGGKELPWAQKVVDKALTSEGSTHGKTNSPAVEEAQVADD